MVEIAITLLIIIIVASIAVPPLLKLGARGRIRSGAASVQSFLRGVRGAAVNEGITVHVRWRNGTSGPVIEALRVNPAQTNRLTNPDWNDKDNEIIRSVMLDPAFRWGSEGFFYFRSDGTASGGELRLENKAEQSRRVEAKATGAGIVDVEIYDE